MYATYFPGNASFFIFSGGLSNIKHKLYFLHRVSWLGWGVQAKIRVYSDRAGGGPRPCYFRCGPRQSSHHLSYVRDSVSGLILDHLKLNMHFKRMQGDSYVY